MDRRMSILTIPSEQMQFMTTPLYMSKMLCDSRAAQWMVKDGIAGSILFICPAPSSHYVIFSI